MKCSDVAEQWLEESSLCWATRNAPLEFESKFELRGESQSRCRSKVHAKSSARGLQPAAPSEAAADAACIFSSSIAALANAENTGLSGGTTGTTPSGGGGSEFNI
jgi:hypothetical protein